MAALSFWTTARSSAMVFAARTLRINCFTGYLSALGPVRDMVGGQAYKKSLRWSHGPHPGGMSRITSCGAAGAWVEDAPAKKRARERGNEFVTMGCCNGG